MDDTKSFFEAAMAPVLQACSRGSVTASTEGPCSAIEAFHAAADNFALEITKVAVFFGNSSRPSQAEAASMLDVAQQRFATICALLYGRVASGAGPSLRSATAAAGKGLLQACQAFLDSLNTPAHADQVPQKVGIIRERCAAVMRAPRDNRAAVGIQLTKIARRVKDVLREAQELAQSASPQEEVTAAPEVADGMAALHLADSHADSSAAGLAAGSANGNGMADDVIVFEGEQLSLSELAIAQAAEQVVRKVMDLLLALIRALSKMDEPTGAELESWESLAFHCKTLETAANDLVADLYGPQDTESVASAAQAVMTGSELIAEELPARLPEGHSKALNDVIQALSSAHEALQADLDAALNHQNAELSAEE